MQTNDAMMPRWKERLGGTLIAILGGGFIAWVWYTAHTEGRFSLKAALIFPCFFVLGVSMFLFTGYKSERIARGENIEGLTGMALITPRWWNVLGLALAAGVGNAVCLNAYLARPLPPVVILITTRYPGAERLTILDDVALPIKRDVSRITQKKILAISESVEGDALTMRVSCAPGSDDIALVLVQNQVALLLGSLPEPVRRHGVNVELESAAKPKP